MPEREDRNALFEKYLSGACTPEEIALIVDQFGVDADEEALRHLIRKALLNNRMSSPSLDAKVVALTQNVASRLNQKIASENSGKDGRQVVWLKKWLTIAATLIGFVSAGIGIYFFVAEDVEQTKRLTSTYGGEVLPGGNRATLKLADGRTVELSENQSGIVIGNEITYRDGSSVLAANGIVSGKDNRSSVAEGTDLMSITTPRGGQYQVALPDGSKVWLNSASTLTYPSKFDRRERVVTLEGEAYFDVAPREYPFRVRTKRQTGEVYGTQFNVSAYLEDDETKTTLVTGSVKVENALRTASKWLVPSQQATLSDDELSVRDVDVTPYIDWKDGLFSFQETSLPDAMAQLSRWYDVEISYDQSVSMIYFFGKIRRDNSLSNVLNILRKSGLNFKIESDGDKNRLLVLP